MGMGNYRGKHEPFFYAKVKGHKQIFYGDRTHGTVVDFHKSEADLARWAKQEKLLEAEGKLTIWTMKRDNTAEYVHPMQKPVELICYALQNSSKSGDIVLDLFGGSGSTIIAAQKYNRSAYVMELDPHFVDVMVQRYVDYTGNEEVKKNGKVITWEMSEGAGDEL